MQRAVARTRSCVCLQHCTYRSVLRAVASQLKMCSTIKKSMSPSARHLGTTHPRKPTHISPKALYWLVQVTTVWSPPNFIGRHHSEDRGCRSRAPSRPSHRAVAPSNPCVRLQHMCRTRLAQANSRSSSWSMSPCNHRDPRSWIWPTSVSMRWSVGGLCSWQGARTS